VSTVPRRSGRQRDAVAAFLEGENTFRSAQSIHGELREQGSGIGLATVYRALQGLVEDREVDALRTDDGEVVYRRCSRAHRRGRGAGRGALGDPGGRGARLPRRQPHPRDLRDLRPPLRARLDETAPFRARPRAPLDESALAGDEPGHLWMKAPYEEGEGGGAGTASTAPP
jgi:hypothetical protein